MKSYRLKNSPKPQLVRAYRRTNRDTSDRIGPPFEPRMLTAEEVEILCNADLEGVHEYTADELLGNGCRTRH